MKTGVVAMAALLGGCASLGYGDLAPPPARCMTAIPKLPVPAEGQDLATLYADAMVSTKRARSKHQCLVKYVSIVTKKD